MTKISARIPLVLSGVLQILLALLYLIGLANGVGFGQGNSAFFVVDWGIASFGVLCGILNIRGKGLGVASTYLFLFASLASFVSGISYRGFLESFMHQIALYFFLPLTLVFLPLAIL